MGRIIIFTGKGGVGKTSVAAAHARKASISGLKTLIISADMAHNLSDLFEQKIGRELTKLEENLYALEIDPQYEMENNFSHLMKAINRMIPGGEGKVEDSEELSMIPGIEELFSLLRIQQIYESDEYEVIIVDCGPTGETLSLLKFPELFAWYMEKLFPVGKFAMRLLHPVSQRLFKIELPDGKAMNDIQRLYKKLYELQDLLKNREVSSIRIVTTPEKMVVDETKRNYMYLNLYNFNVDGIFINRILPENINQDFFEDWLKLQAEYINELESVFANIPRYKIKWYDEEITGLKAIDLIVNDVFTDNDILSVKMNIQNEEYEKDGDGYLLKVYLPCVSKNEVTIHENGSDIIIRIGNLKRSIPLPKVLRKYRVEGAKFSEDSLDIRFVKVKGEPEHE